MQEKKYRVLLLGSGGREHTLAWKLVQSPLLETLFIAPGNAGTAGLGTNLSIKETDFISIKEVVLQQGINLVVVGPEAPLVKGIADYFAKDEQLLAIPVIGPSASGARLEGSKDFAKKFMQRHQIPTAAYQSFSSEELPQALDFLKTIPSPYVLKADGLAAGKGVVICQTLEEASKELTEMLQNKKFGEASQKVVIEHFLKGIELSVFVLTDGKSYLLLPEAKDYKRIGEGDTGPNTGGMGSISPVPFADESFMEKVTQKIIKPTINGLQQENIPYWGFIFFGLIKVDDEPYVIEYNARLGDPETEVILPRLKNDLLEFFDKLVTGRLAESHIETHSDHAACVMMVAPGYPGDYPKGLVLSGISEVDKGILFHAGTALDKDSGLVTSNGGRIMGLTAMGKNLAEALHTAYGECQKIHYEGKYFRTDLGMDVLKG